MSSADVNDADIVSFFGRKIIETTDRDAKQSRELSGKSSAASTKSGRDEPQASESPAEVETDPPVGIVGAGKGKFDLVISFPAEARYDLYRMCRLVCRLDS